MGLRQYEQEYSALFGEEISAGAFPLSPYQIGIIEGSLFTQSKAHISEQLAGHSHEELLTHDDFLTGVRRGIFMRFTQFPEAIRIQLQELHS